MRFVDLDSPISPEERRYPTATEVDSLLNVISSGGVWTLQEITDSTGIMYHHVAYAVRNLCKRRLVKSFEEKEQAPRFMYVRPKS